MPQWKKLERGAVRSSTSQPTVGIQANKGNISLNQAAFLALGGPQAVEILYDPEERLFGLRAAQPSTANYPLHKQGSSATYLVAGGALVRVMGIDNSQARRYDGNMIEDVLTVDLKSRGTPALVGAPSRK